MIISLWLCLISTSVPSSHLQHLSSRLARLAVEEKLCHSFQAFHSSYSDTGLLGIHFVADKHYIEDMMHWSQNAWSVITQQRRECHNCIMSLFNCRKMHIFCLISSTFCSLQDELVHHCDREWCSQRQDGSEGQPGWTAQWYATCLSFIYTNAHKNSSESQVTHLFVFKEQHQFATTSADTSWTTGGVFLWQSGMLGSMWVDTISAIERQKSITVPF